MRNSIISIGFLQKIRKILPLVFGLLLFVGTVQAEMVDTFQFQNEAESGTGDFTGSFVAMFAMSEPKFGRIQCDGGLQYAN